MYTIDKLKCIIDYSKRISFSLGSPIKSHQQVHSSRALITAWHFLSVKTLNNNKLIYTECL